MIQEIPRPEPVVEEQQADRLMAKIFGAILIGLILGGGFTYLIILRQGNTTIDLNNTGNMTAAYQYGIVMTITQMMNQTNDCQIVTLQTTERNRTLADVDCFRKILQERNITLS